ncbi:MAG: hypothetical protein ACT6Q9_02925 [Polaromonas sp.]|uniref:hypothetical protein n=1 Tax=Polaromonas sp. TaxID=1869339 RepID=UPI00403676D8
MTIRSLALAGLALALCVGAGAATDDAAARKLALVQALSAQVQGQTPVSGASPVLSAEGSKAVEQAFVQNIKGSADHDAWKRGFIESSWMWHLWSTGLLFVLVVGIVCFGLYLTYVQFNRDYSAWSPPPQGSKAEVAAAGEAADGGAATARLAPAIHSVKINAGGLELTSQVVGLLVLAFSLAFFYFYVHRVYPMQTEELTQLKDKETEGKTSSGSEPGKPPGGS